MTAALTMQQFCNAADFDAATQTCAAPYWAVAYGGLPPLSVEDALLIAGATWALWAVAWLIRPFAKTLLRRS
jgi:hypothetical protein